MHSTTVTTHISTMNTNIATSTLNDVMRPGRMSVGTANCWNGCDPAILGVVQSPAVAPAATALTHDSMSCVYWSGRGRPGLDSDEPKRIWWLVG